MKLHVYKKNIARKLLPHSAASQLDAELLLMHVLKFSRAELLLQSDKIITEKNQQQIDALIARRLNGEPIAYLLGHQPFWTMDLWVTPDTLIPRPETECLVEWILHHFAASEKLSVADVGTGSGAIAIALAVEKKLWRMDAADIASESLVVAKKNLEKYDVKNIALYVSDWFSALTEKKYDVIVSNPPYIAENDLHLSALTFEPQHALVSGADGLDAIRWIVNDAKKFLKPNGYVVIEHGYDQGNRVADIFKKAGFTEIKNHRDLSDVARFVTGKFL